MVKERERRQVQRKEQGQREQKKEKKERVLDLQAVIKAAPSLLETRAAADDLKGWR